MQMYTLQAWPYFSVPFDYISALFESKARQ